MARSVVVVDDGRVLDVAPDRPPFAANSVVVVVLVASAVSK